MSNKKGFTLIELIVVVAILGILSLILVPSLMGYAKDAKEAGCLSNRTNIERLFRYYEAKHPDEKKTLLDYLSMEDGQNKISDFKCPSGGVYGMDADDRHVVTCSEHLGTTEDIPSSGDKINGTELGKDKVLQIKNGDKSKVRLEVGQVIEMKFEDGSTLQYIVRYPIGNDVIMNETTYGLLPLTKEKAIEMGNKNQKEFYEHFKDPNNPNAIVKIPAGTKVYYNDTYYISKENISGDMPMPGIQTVWLEIKE